MQKENDQRQLNLLSPTLMKVKWLKTTMKGGILMNRNLIMPCYRIQVSNGEIDHINMRYIDEYLSEFNVYHPSAKITKMEVFCSFDIRHLEVMAEDVLREIIVSIKEHMKLLKKLKELNMKYYGKNIVFGRDEELNDMINLVKSEIERRNK